MSQLVDNLIAFRILNLLVTDFVDTKAYKLGVIDEKGNPLKKLKDMTSQERDSYTMLHRLVFRIKKILSKVPMVGTKLGTLAAAYFLVRECVDKNKTPTNLEEEFLDLLTKMRNESIILAEEYLLVEEFLSEEVPTNATGAAVKTDEPVVRKKKFGRFSVSPAVFSRFSRGKRKGIKEQLGYADDEDMIYNFAKQNPGSVAILHNNETGEVKAVKFNTKQGWGM